MVEPSEGNGAANESNNVPRFELGPMALSDEPLHGVQTEHRNDNESRATGTESLGEASATTNEAIDILRMLVQNEQFSPEILPFQTEAIDSLRSLVDSQTELVDAEEDDDAVDQLSFESQLKRMELDRINYQLRHYFRLRIKKVQSLIMFIFKTEGPFERLSESEKRFAVSYSDLVEEHFNKAFLNLLPQRLQIVEKDGAVEPVTPPNLDRFVFCRVRTDLGEYVIGEDASDDSLELNKGDILCIRYKSIQDLIQSEDVELL